VVEKFLASVVPQARVGAEVAVSARERRYPEHGQQESDGAVESANGMPTDKPGARTAAAQTRSARSVQIACRNVVRDVAASKRSSKKRCNLAFFWIAPRGRRFECPEGELKLPGLTGPTITVPVVCPLPIGNDCIIREEAADRLLVTPKGERQWNSPVISPVSTETCELLWISVDLGGRDAPLMATAARMGSGQAIPPDPLGKRRGWDSNPRDASRRLAVFKTAPFNHSGTPPKARVSLARARGAFPGCAELLENRRD
jgi:hypothetical protein